MSRFVTELDTLGAAGLSLHDRLDLLRNLNQGLVTHRQRACFATGQAWASLDLLVVDTVDRWLGGGKTGSADTLVFAPAKQGGLGYASAVARAEAAFLASWECAATRVAANCSRESERALLSAIPQLARQVQQAQNSLAAKGAPVRARSEKPGRQKQLCRPVVEAAIKELRASITIAEHAILESGCTTQGRAWLHPPTRPDHEMSNDEVASTTRRRLLYPDPSGRASALCGHRSANGRKVCTHSKAAPDFGVHDLTCEVGPGWILRHNYIRDAWATWLKGRFGYAAVDVEAEVPLWKRERFGRPPEHAVLDLIVRLPGQGTFALDISVTEAACPTNLQGRQPRPAAAARRREAEKHRRYPARAGVPTLVPVVYECGGRPGPSAEAWLRRVTGDEDAETRAASVRDLRQTIAVALQRGNAALLTAGGPPASGWPWSGR